MKWFKHDAHSLHKANIEKLIMEYGIEGYGLYYACVEIIAGNLTTENVTFELEHDAKIMAHKFRMDTLKVEEIMHKCIEYELFDLADSGHIRCLSLARMMDESTSRNPGFSKLQKFVKKSGIIPEKLPKRSGQKPKNSEQNRIEQNRIEEKRKEEKEYYRNEYFSITESEHSEYKSIYPFIDIDTEYMKMKRWLDINPKKRKSDYPKFIYNWLSNAKPKQEEKDELEKYYL